jgi:hypothetical protein
MMPFLPMSRNNVIARGGLPQYHPNHLPDVTIFFNVFGDCRAAEKQKRRLAMTATRKCDVVETYTNPCPSPSDRVLIQYHPANRLGGFISAYKLVHKCAYRF